jgi:hypothetical protein
MDIGVQLRAWMEWTGLAVHKHCAKRRRLAAHRALCPPPFPTTQKGKGGATVVTGKPCSSQRLSNCIKAAVSTVGCDTSRFSGISARKGGLPTAIDAGVSEAGLFLQSGHCQAKAAHNYMQLSDSLRLLGSYDTFEL